MAVDGKTLSDTLRHGSDVYIDIPCSPCAKDNIKIEACKYCVECDENICAKWESNHKKFAGMRSHQIENNPRADPWRKITTKRCYKHGGNLVDEYCSDHNVVGCSTCIEVEHSACSGIKYISDAVKGIDTSKELKDLDVKLKNTKQKLIELRQQKEVSLKQLRDEKDKIKNDISVLREKINGRLDKMEKTLTSNVETLYDKRINAVNNVIDMINDMNAQMETKQRDLKEAMQEISADLLVYLRNESASLDENMHLLRDLEEMDDKLSVKWYPSSDIDRILSQNSNIFGMVCEVSVPKSVYLVGDFNITYSSDKESCDVTDICLSRKGDVFLIDFGNKSLKKLDQSFAVKDVVKFRESPMSVCEIDRTNIAVSLTNDRRVQFISQDTLTLGQAFSVGNRCSGICAEDNLIYVCCGGYPKTGEDIGHIEVYNTDGQRQRFIYNEIASPYRICICGQRDEIIVATEISVSVKKLIRIDKNYHTVSDIKLQNLSNPQGIVRIGKGLLCIAGLYSNNILLVSEDGELEEELLTKNDGIVDPVSVCFDEKQSRLLVSQSNSNVIKVFSFVM